MSKRFLKYVSAILSAAAFLCGCSEKVDVHTRNMDRTYLVVEAFLDDIAGRSQDITLTESISYFSNADAPAVTGAYVSVSAESSTFDFREVDGKPGVYRAPEDFAAVPGTTYTLHIDATVGGKAHTYHASSTMLSPGVEIDSIRCYYAAKPEMEIDSLWMVTVWGKDRPGHDNYYINASVNGLSYPVSQGLEIDDKYFDGRTFTAFGIFPMFQTEQRYKRYGECCKYLEADDVVSLSVCTVEPGFLKFLSSFSSGASSITMPLFTPPPATAPTNIFGADALGYFAVSSASVASCVIADPMEKVPSQSGF